MIFGVDEAGKGPAIGSMFAAAVAVPDPSVLPADVDDSKSVHPDRREEMARELRADDRVAVGVAEVEPARIDDPESDMNALTVRAHAEAVVDLADGGPDLDGARGLLDAGDVDADRFARRVRDLLAADPVVEAEHGADASSSVVGAASVVAKVERDAHVDRLATEYGDLGSGYPSDPATREFLREYVATNGDLPACARASWSTCEDVLAAAEQSRLEEF